MLATESMGPQAVAHTVIILFILPRDADRWSGIMGFTPDGLPLVGSLPDLPRVYFAVGLGGRGLAWAFVVAERLVELMLNDTDPGILSAARLG